jgi:hypothetical protein
VPGAALCCYTSELCEDQRPRRPACIITSKFAQLLKAER